MTTTQSNKNILITGASRGIGFALAQAFSFADHNYTVYANYNKTYAPLQMLAEELIRTGRPHTLVPIKADVSQKSEIADLLSQTNGIDILINNAGIAQIKPFMDITESDWDTMLDINLKSAFLCSQAVLPYMIHNKTGCIINISSVWGVTGGSCEVHYSAAKAGMIGFTKALAKELAPSGIRVNCIAPGVIDTGMNNELHDADLEQLKEQTPLGTIGQPDHVVQAAFFLAENEFITGEILNINGGFHI